MRRRGRGTALRIVAAMLLAAAAGRSLDALAALPGVHETSAVRAGPTAWCVAFAAAALVGALASGQWSRTASVRRTAAVAAPGQLAVFLSAEAVVRLSHGLGAVDPDGVVGAGLQAAVAVVLLALAVTAGAALRCTPLHAVQPPVPRTGALPRTTHPRGLLHEIRLIARGPPRPTA